MIKSVAEIIVDSYTSGIDYTAEINKEAFITELRNTFGIEKIDGLDKKGIDAPALIEEISEKALQLYEEKEKEIGTEEMRELERMVMLQVVDRKWMEHIDAMDELKDGIGLRAYGQKDPVVQYRIEGFDMFDQMIVDMKMDVVKILLHIHKVENMQRKSQVKIVSEGKEAGMPEWEGANQKANRPNETTKQEPIVNDGPKVGRNDLCPCGSGKKYKNCCGKNA